MHTAGTSLAGIPANAAGHGSLIEDVIEVPWDEPDSLRAAIDDVGQERVAAFFCEPVIGAGGVYPPPDGYLEAVRQVCRDTDVLFVADEVITGFGRCGDWFASTRFGAGTRHRRLREGDHERLPAARRGPGVPSRRRTLLGRGRGDVAARLHLQRPRGRRGGGAGEHRHPRARGPSREIEGDGGLARRRAQAADRSRPRRGRPRWRGLARRGAAPAGPGRGRSGARRARRRGDTRGRASWCVRWWAARSR